MSKTDYIEITQTPGMSDGEMMEHISDKIQDGWELFGYEKKVCKVWTFQRASDEG